MPVKYGHNHRKIRERWGQVVARGDGWCQQGLPGNGSSGTCVHRTRWIPPGTAWHLGHADDGETIIGPCHARCNILDGASRGGKITGGRNWKRAKPRAIPRPWQSRAW